MPIAPSNSQIQPTEIKEEITSKPLVSSPPEIDRSLFENLDVWGREAFDPDTQDKVKFIGDYLKDRNGLSIHSIITELGATPLGITKLERIYKYLRLKQQGEKISQQMSSINNELEVIKTGVKSNWRKNQWG